ncbi:regulator of nonsense transcripts 1 isoform X3 [Aedes aegypti]|uniref:Uncharacterized protein n=1 Tax=Aedes aegypti TaxID=7159 RepID=A0A6I8U3Y6_AEDAE|nr:regulator of nonsense transcripts 1 isoform X3 [Aedes aegypti]
MDNDSGGSGFWHHNTAPWENNEPSSPVSDSSSGKWFPKTVQSVELLIETEKSSTDEDVTPMQTNNNDESPDLPILPADCIMTSKIDSPPACREKIRSDQIVPKSPDIEHIQTRMFNQQTANEGRAEKNRNNRSLAYAKARAELKKKPPKKCRTRNGKTNKPKKAHLKKYDKVDIVLDVKRITTLIRFVSEQNQSSSECELRRTCPLCTTSILESAIREHFVNCHGAKFSLEPLLTADIRNHVISREVLQVKLKQDPHRNGSYFLLTVTNIAAVTILLKSIYVFDGIGTLSPIFSAEGVLRMKPGFFYEDELQLQVSDECVQSLLVTVNPIDELRATYDVVEQYHIKKVCTKCTRIAGFQWINIGISTNEEQMVAVRNIVNRTSFPAPYVLFGPPGTGKSSTLVEVIGQIYKLHPEANMLVVAPSNFAANEITSRILNVVPEKHVFRYFSRSSIRTVNDIDENILQISNMADKKYDLPYYQDIYLARIVVTTLATAGRLVQANIRAKHFRYVIVDECGSAKEISSLVPIGGLATCGDEIHASIVLAGDPKQLGPVIQHNYLKQTNHNVSLLERIMKLDLYEMNRTTKEYNNRYITQLRDNFRSHSMLLNFPNKTFYAGQLRAKASPELTNWALGWHRLPNPKCPLIFHSIFGNMQQHENSTSLFNVVEGELVLCYLTDILHHGINGRQVRQCDIGLISPYASQILHLRTLCIARGWEDIEIGSAEQYQGREKAIIIMSTVRSRSKHLGFLTNAKRLNVTITRARALMIIIGDGYTLQNDANWKALVNYCRQQKAFVYGRTPIFENEKKSEKAGHGKSLLSSATPNLAHVKDDLIVLTDKSDETPANTVASKITPKAEINPKPNREIPGKDKKQWQARRISTRVRT